MATGTADPLDDTRLQNETKIPHSAVQLFGNNRHSAISNHQSNDRDLVHGELMTFANPGFDLPPIDRLEAFDPNGRCVYTRVLVAMESNGDQRCCWTYTMEDYKGRERLTSGKWG